jgi:hypothetical protein
MTSLVLLLLLFGAGPDPALRIEAGTDAATVKVVARLSPVVAGRVPAGKLSQKDGERWLRLALVTDKGEASGAILGAYQRDGDTLTFVPRFRLAAGERYRAVLTTGDNQSVRAEYAVPPKPPAAPAAVETVYPTADKLPANLLKFYLHFSKPMREGPAVFDHVQLLDDKGEPVEDPWRRTELWNADATRLTLWVHPGRIKEGVNLRDDLGPVLEPNRRYTLVVSEKLSDAEGRPLGKAFKKVFRTTAAARDAIEVSAWTAAAPEPGTRKPLVVTFPRPLDRALLDRSLTITDAVGKPIAGRGEVGTAERSWAFTPEMPWAVGAYTITAADRLEDLAGNTLLRPFDRNLDLPQRKDPPRSLPFRVGK